MSPVKRCQKQCIEGNVLSDGKTHSVQKRGKDSVNQVPYKIRQKECQTFSKQIAYDMVLWFFFIKIAGYKEENKNMKRIIRKETTDVKKVLTKVSGCHQDNADSWQDSKFFVFFIFSHRMIPHTRNYSSAHSIHKARTLGAFSLLHSSLCSLNGAPLMKR